MWDDGSGREEGRAAGGPRCPCWEVHAVVPGDRQQEQRGPDPRMLSSRGGADPRAAEHVVLLSWGSHGYGKARLC